MKRGSRAHGVGRQDLRHHGQVATLGGVHADADARVGNDHIGHALRGNAGLPGSDDAVDDAHVSVINPVSARAEALFVSPELQRGGAACCQRQPEACIVVATRQGLPDAARRAGDEHQGTGHAWHPFAAAERKSTRLIISLLRLGRQARWRLAGGSRVKHAANPTFEVHDLIEVVVGELIAGELISPTRQHHRLV